MSIIPAFLAIGTLTEKQKQTNQHQAEFSRGLTGQRVVMNAATGTVAMTQLTVIERIAHFV
jgi:hypothetical protein